MDVKCGIPKLAAIFAIWGKDHHTCLLFVFATRKVTHKPMAAIRRNEIRRLDMPAIRPITGGPIRNPRKPMLVTAASAAPGESVFDLPASLYTRGTTAET